MSPDANSGSLAPSRGLAPRVSFIVPLFNCLALTQAMLTGLRATIPPGTSYEIILIDDGSTDGTRAWLATLDDPRIQIRLNERNLGFAAANNRATAVARGELFIFLNNDLILLPGWLEPMFAAHRKLGTRAGLVGNVQLDASTELVDHVGIVFDVKAKPGHDRRPPSPLASILLPVREVPAVTAACVLMASSLWRELGGFDEGYHNGGEDVDLCFRARAAGRVNAVALRSVIKHHVSASAGRKARDESNSELLARRWRTEFIACAARHWCRDYVAAILADPRSFPPALALRLWLFTHRLGRTVPSEAIDALNRAIDLEFVRWAKLPR
jgi:O-antigen biosynthesis protein